MLATCAAILRGRATLLPSAKMASTRPRGDCSRTLLIAASVHRCPAYLSTGWDGAACVDANYKIRMNLGVGGSDQLDNARLCERVGCGASTRLVSRRGRMQCKVHLTGCVDGRGNR
eukprot:scaffold51882_cov63-Phaeocystis_antarctica.AAC.1